MPPRNGWDWNLCGTGLYTMSCNLQYQHSDLKHSWFRHDYRIIDIRTGSSSDFCWQVSRDSSVHSKFQLFSLRMHLNTSTLRSIDFQDQFGARFFFWGANSICIYFFDGFHAPSLRIPLRKDLGNSGDVKLHGEWLTLPLSGSWLDFTESTAWTPHTGRGGNQGSWQAASGQT